MCKLTVTSADDLYLINYGIGIFLKSVLNLL